MNVRPDGILGAIVGSESMGLTDTLVNGAGGCRSRAQIALHELIPEHSSEDPGCCGSRYFSKQSRLPCTYINGDDIVFGTGGKVSDGLREVGAVTGRRALLVDTLGASLLCTDYTSMDPRPITVEGDLASMPFDAGYDLATEAVLRSLDIVGGDDRMSVNILGYGIPDLGWTYGRDELRSLLGLMGVRVNAFVGCMPSREEVSASGGSALNIAIHPSRCSRTASFYRERFGIPVLRPSRGAPVGYRATRSLLEEVGDALGADPSPAIAAVDADERRVRSVLMNSDRAADGLRARSFSVECESSVALPLTRWMSEVFGMVPGSVRILDDGYAEEIRGMLDAAGFPEALGAGDRPDTEVHFTDGLSAAEGRMRKDVPAWVEVTMPRGRTLDLMGRCLVGRPGCRYILDEVLNGVTRFRCGQPTAVDLR